MIEPAYKDGYWSIVEDCLVAIHGLNRSDARKKGASLRKKMERTNKGVTDDLFYHNEPFYVACDIADHELPVEDDVIRCKYDGILAAHGWLPAKPSMEK